MLAAVGDTLVSINSHRANRVAELGLRTGAFSQLEEWQLQKSEFSWGSSRFDFLLKRKEMIKEVEKDDENQKEKGENRLLLEVKSVTWVREEIACFPDAVTSRGRRHVEELIRWQQETGGRAMVLFLLGRNDAASFRPCREIDPDFADSLKSARDAGVIISAYRSRVSLSGIRPGEKLPVNWQQE
ncbi:sugar fermentation stimulation protein [Halarsenatibacter silvermanii]|uniref:Sugar fermentation stimulation protein n=1 Tax=Halarsenatibacter silvermanii TaxID=321763 RepID=A0A1G9H0T3_9FIRM|nr:sugar fermentation stimulation protein [Halarsenatibacter silvermanii]